MKDELLALAERCEKATGPDRELDCRITASAHPSMAGEFRIVGPPTYEPERYFSGQEGIDWIGYDLLNNAPLYTASLDAAMTLVPEGWYWQVGQGNHAWAAAYENPIPPSMRVDPVAATPALALCAAALRARAAITVKEASHASA